MKNTVKEDWKRRVCAVITALLVMLVIMALWCRGRSFARVLQIGSEDVGRIVVVRGRDPEQEITDRETIDGIMSCVNHFRYMTYFDRRHLCGVAGYYIKLYSQGGRELSRLNFTDEAVLVYNCDVYMASSPYFADLQKQLFL